jgi:hypothetical protein
LLPPPPQAARVIDTVAARASTPAQVVLLVMAGSPYIRARSGLTAAE